VTDVTTSALADALRDRYTLERELGRGGMATVYLAHDVKHARPVALKVIHPDLATTLGPERFLREIRLTAQLQHPHILPLFDSGEAAGQLWYVMPYVEGASLRHRLEREHQLPLDVAIQIARNVLSALAYAHECGVVHRDIKPENILLERGDAVVGDFGIAHAVTAAGSERLTETGLALGTPAYMSPEQAAGERALDGRSDLYGMACVLYEMLAGEPPFTGPSAQAVLARHTLDPVPPLRTVRKAVPPHVEAAVKKALEKVAADRFGTAAEFAEALTTGAVSTTPVGVTPLNGATPALPLSTPPARRVRLVLGALGLTALAAAAVLVLERQSAPPATSAATSAAAGAAAVTRLAVLPFENLGDSGDAYFADGVADAVRGKLTALAGLEVIARASSMAYRKTNKTPQEVARELGVRYLLTGTVRWAKAQDRTSRVQVSPELVEVREAGAPASKWQQPFDAALTDVFQVQADIAGRVAQALNLALGAQERQQLVQRPTADLAAYDAFLKGEAAAQALAAEDPPSLRRAAAFYEEAVARDSTFGLAWARLADVHALLYGLSSLNPADAKAARRALLKAEHLTPAAPETYRAQAEYEELVRQDFVRALAAAEAGLARAPDQSELMAYAAVEEWRLGRLEAAVARLTRARTIDPRSLIILHYLAPLLSYQKHWSEARRALDQALSLSPTDLDALEYKAMTYLGEGDLPGARRVLAEAPPAVVRSELAADVAAYDAYWVLDDEAQQQALTLPPSAFDDNRGTWAIARAQLYYLRSDTAMARVYADSARIAYQAQLQAVPEDGAARVFRGLALAYLGGKAEAITEGERAAELLPMSRDGIWGPRVQHQLVRIYILVGEPEKALDRLELLLTVPYWISPGWLRIDPNFAPLRGNPRFERLVAGK
jgi:TolB-like protein/Flp pilus assembly protein TadD